MAAYGCTLRKCRRHGACPSTDSSAPSPRKIPVYLLNNAPPSPNPARYQPHARPCFNATLVPSRHTSQKNSSAESIVAINPVPKYTGRMISSAAADNAASRPNHILPNTYITTLDASIISAIPARTPNSVSPNNCVPNQISHATIGG